MNLTSTMGFGRTAVFVALTAAMWLARPSQGQQPRPDPKAEILDRPEKLAFPPLQYQPPRPAEHRVILKNGPVTYIIPDRELPLVQLTIYLRAGAYLVSDGKEGLSDLTGYLLARGGTESKPADELDERLDFLAARLNSRIGETHGVVSLNLLSKDLGEGLDILRDVLARPKFQEDKLALRKQQMLQEMKQRNDDAAEIEARERRFLAYGEHFWINRYPTAASVTSVTRPDLKAFQERWIHPANFIVAASGDFTRDAMIAKLEHLFQNWPHAGERTPPMPTNTIFASPGGGYLINKKEINQGRVSVLLPGILWDNPDYFAITVMNDILGGGFTSRIMNRVRSEEGLAYSAGSHFPAGVFFPSYFTASCQSKSRTVAYATSILLEEMRQMASGSPTEEELETSKRSFIDSFPTRFATKAQTAATFAEDELTGRYVKNPEYWQTYRANIEAVAAPDVERVARTYLPTGKVVALIIGPKEDILRGDPDHPVSLPSLTQGRLVDLPLRDPLTMKPLPLNRP